MVSLAICIVIRICSKDSSKILQDHGTLAKVTIVKDGTFLLVSKRRIFILICAKKILCALFSETVQRIYVELVQDDGILLKQKWQYLKKRLFVPKCINFSPCLGSKDSVLFSFCESAWGAWIWRCVRDSLWWGSLAMVRVPVRNFAAVHQESCTCIDTYSKVFQTHFESTILK